VLITFQTAGRLELPGHDETCTPCHINPGDRTAFSIAAGGDCRGMQMSASHVGAISATLTRFAKVSTGESLRRSPKTALEMPLRPKPPDETCVPNLEKAGKPALKPSDGWWQCVFIVLWRRTGAIGRRGAENGASRRLRDIAANASGLTLAAPWLQAFVSVWVSPQLEARIAGLDSVG